MSADSMKYVRALNVITTGSISNVMQWHFKLLYEFWGFCVNGGTSLTIPGGMPTDALSMPTGFQSGSATLIASGSDGSTQIGDSVFTAPSVNWFSGTMIGRYLVTWQSGSSSTDDSIYKIVRVVSSSSILVNVNSGATPHTGSNKLAFTTRTNVNFRVVDITSASILSGFVSGSRMIFTMNGGSFNVGQRNPQIKLAVKTVASSLSSCAISMSPSGSWTGSAFTDATPELDPDTTTPGTNNSGGTNRYWFNGTSGVGRISLWADQGSLIMHTRGDWNDAASYFHVEVPRRLYSEAKDPNPVCYMNSGIRGISAINSGISSSQHHYAAGWHVSNPLDNTVLRRWNLMARCPIGYSFFEHESQCATRPGYNSGIPNDQFKNRYFNHRNETVLVFDLILGHRHTSTSYSIGRVQLRRAAINTEMMPIGIKIGANGEWIHVGDGILWPWDNADLPYSILAAGS